MKAKKTSALFTKKAIKEHHRLRVNCGNLLEAWAANWVELQLRTLPVRYAEQHRKLSKRRNLTTPQRAEYRELARYWDRVAAMPLAEKAKEFYDGGYFEEDFMDVLDTTPCVEEVLEDVRQAIDVALLQFMEGKRVSFNGAL